MKNQQSNQDLARFGNLLGQFRERPLSISGAERKILTQFQSDLNQLLNDPPTPAQIETPSPFQSLVESITDGVITLNRDWQITYINPRAARNGNREPVELIGQNIWEAFPDLLNTQLEIQYRKVMLERTPVQFEMKGVIRAQWYLVNVYPSADGITVVWLDNTTTKEVERQNLRLLEEHQRHKALLEAIFEADPSGIAVLVGEDLGFAYANPIYRCLCPDPFEDPLGKPYDQVWPQMSENGHRVRFRNVLATGQPFLVSGVIHSFPDKTKRIFTLQARRIEWADQPAVLVLMWDTTEQSQAQQQAEQKTAQLQAVLEALPVGVVILDRQGGILQSNHMYAQIWGGSPPATQTVEDYTAFQAWWVDTGQPVQPDEWASARAIQKGETVIGQELRIQRFDGREAFVLNSAVPIQEPEGQVVGGVVAILDITDRLVAEQALQEEKENYQRILETANEGIMIADQSGIITYANPYMAEMLGYSIAELVGKPGVSLIDSTSFSVAREKITSRGQGLRDDYEIKFLRKDGSNLWMLASGAPIRNSQNQHIGNLGMYVDISERKQAEEALRLSEGKYRELFETMQEFLIVVEVIPDEQGNPFDYRYLALNPAAERMAGFSQEQAVGHTYRELAPTINPDVIATVGKVASTGESVTTEWFSYPQKRWVQQHLFSPRQGQAVFLGVDITERKVAEESQRESEQLYRAIGESIDYGVWVCDPDGRNLYASDSYLKLVGITQQQCSDFGWGDTLHPADAERTIAAWKECVRTGGTWDIEHRFRGVDGQWHPILARGVPVRNQQGEIRYWAGINLDISRQKQTEQALRESETRFRIMADNNPILIWVTDAQGNNQFVNRTYCEFFGITFDQVEGGKWQPFIHPDDRPAYLAAFERAVQAHVPFKGEMRAQRKDGEWRQLSTSAEPRFSESGEFLGHVGNSADITDRKKDEEEAHARTIQIELQRRLLGQREQERQQIARDLHDGPVQELTGVDFALEEILYTTQDEALAQALRAVREAIKSQVAELRDYAGELRPPALARFGLDKALLSYAEQFQEKYPPLRIDVETPQDGEFLPQDVRTALFRIFQESLQNIHKHAQATAVKVRLTHTQDLVILEIADNGVGLAVPRDWLELARAGHLGLVGMRERAEAIGGKVEITSQDGRGAQIKVTVSLDATPA